MSAVDIFSPFGDTATLSVTTTTGRVALTLASVPMSSDVRIVNDGGVTAFIAFGDSTVTATASTGMPVLPGTVEVFSVSPKATHIAAITASGAATVYATGGRGA